MIVRVCRLKYLILLLVGCWLFGRIARARADMEIDSFQDTQGPIFAGDAQGTVALTQEFPHVVGGRGLALAATAAGIAGSNPLGVAIDQNGTTVLQYDSLSAGASGNLFLSYGGNSGQLLPAQPMGLPVNPGIDVLRLSFATYNHANGMDLDIKTFLQTQLYQVTLSPPSQTEETALTTGGAGIVDIPLNSLNGTSLDFVTFEFTAPPSTSFQLDSVSLVTGVPEPGTFALLGTLGVILLGCRIARPMYGRAAR